MYTLVAFVPILFAVVTMVKFNWSASKAIPCSWALACIIGTLVWDMSFWEAGARTVFGFFNASETLLIILGAIMIMNILKHSGAVSAINRIFSSITRDARIQMVIVGFIFGGFIEGAAGFGTPAALAAPLLISLGFPPLAAAVCALICNSTPVVPGPVGIPTITAAQTVSTAVTERGASVDTFLLELTKASVIPNVVGGFVIIFVAVCVLVKFFGKNKSVKDALPALPFCLFTGTVLFAIYVPLAFFTGPELVSLVSFLGTLPIVIIAAKKGWFMPKEAWTFDGVEEWAHKSWLSTQKAEAPKDNGMNPAKAWLPYVLVAIILIVSRLEIFGVKAILNNSVFSIAINNILGYEGINWVFKYLWNPGIVPFMLVAVLTVFIHRMEAKEVKTAVMESLRQISGAAVALLFGVAMVNIYRYSSSGAIGLAISGSTVIQEFTYANSSMLFAMAKALADIFQGAYFIVAPLIGVLGAFISGSCTVSNTLFAALQFETATLLVMPQVLVVALQNLGGAIGNMVCVNNIVAACATTGTIGNEGKIMKINVIPCIIYCAVVATVMGALIAAGVNPMPELLN